MNAIERLVDIVRTLRGPNGCPWDKVQTYQSLIPYVIEEAYEVVDALENSNPESLKEELGDMLLHVVMLSAMAEDLRHFNLEEVATDISEKMIRRHPHVFASTQVDSVEDVVHNWEAIKKQEKQEKQDIRFLESVPKSLPALIQAQKYQKKAAKLQFDWPDVQSCFEKVKEEINEVETTLKQNDTVALEEELGDLLFSVVNVARKSGLDAEALLKKANQKFKTRLYKVEDALIQTKASFTDKTPEELNTLWEQVKAEK